VSARAYVLIETSVGKTKDVVLGIRKLNLEGIEEVNLVTGPYDVIAVVEGTDLTEISNLVTSKIPTVGGIERTVTCMAVDFA
jgi:DNA-binding Lrp family transcriptional regulator